MEFTVKQEAEVRDSGVYEPAQLVDIDTYNGRDNKGEAYTSLIWEFADENGELIVTFTTANISASSNAGKMMSGILGRDITPGERITKADLMGIPLRLLVTREKSGTGKWKNHIPEIRQSQKALPGAEQAVEGEVVDDDAPF